VYCSRRKPFREYEGWEYNNFPLPDDYRETAGMDTRAVALHAGEIHAMFDHINRWTVDYPRSDRHLLRDPAADANQHASVEQL